MTRSDAEDDRSRDDLAGASSLAELGEGYMVDYEMRTWEVTRHARYDREGWPADEWRLESGGDVLFLEHEVEDGEVFRLSEPADITDVTVEGESFLAAVRGENSPSIVEYRGDEYMLAEEDARVADHTIDIARSRTDRWLMGVCGGFADYFGVSASLVRVGFVVGVVLLTAALSVGCLLIPAYFALGVTLPEQSPSSPGENLTHYWRYKGPEGFVTFESTGSNDWDVYAGREVEPYEFDNILPRSTS